MASDYALDERDAFFERISQEFKSEDEITAEWLVKYVLENQEMAYVIPYIYLDCLKWPTDKKLLTVIRNCLNCSSSEQPQVNEEYFYRENGFRYPNGRNYDVVYIPKDIPITKFSDKIELRKVIDDYIAWPLRTNQEFSIKLHNVLEELVKGEDFLEKDFNFFIDNIDLFFQVRDERHKQYFLECLDECLSDYMEFCAADEEPTSGLSYEEDEGTDLAEFYCYLRDFYYHFYEVVAGTYQLPADPGLFAKMLNGAKDEEAAKETYPQTIVYVDRPNEDFFAFRSMSERFVPLYRQKHPDVDFIDADLMKDILTTPEEKCRHQAELIADINIKFGLTKRSYAEEVEKEYKKALKTYLKEIEKIEKAA